MAQFKVGDRVRVRKDAIAARPHLAQFLGAETSIVAPSFVANAWQLALIGPRGPVHAQASALEPILDTGLDSFLKRVKNLSRRKPIPGDHVDPREFAAGVARRYGREVVRVTEKAAAQAAWSGS